MSVNPYRLQNQEIVKRLAGIEPSPLSCQKESTIPDAVLQILCPDGKN